MNVAAAIADYQDAKQKTQTARVARAAILVALNEANDALSHAQSAEDDAEKRLLFAVTVAGCPRHEPTYDPCLDALRCASCGMIGCMDHA